MQSVQSEDLKDIRATILEKKEGLAETKRQELADTHHIYTELTNFRVDLITIYKWNACRNCSNHGQIRHRSERYQKFF
ncbi:hypothetical protein [Priestia megaterium]|uniref:hypothetical protein n=1 Tax=Priestia megaterium TaxID=1404 RepID=UPI002E20D888|nr:hypothetical protein [Priestia megaterium]MED4268480.1 hypothetical protein [Priestia megaterium]MED4278348.1 hypothetical protein [Priestia megaterium]MED4319666.1 hypothetical protein [Priestia megaterium]